MTIYIEMVDWAGHDKGPASQEVNDALVRADEVLGYLMEGLRSRKLEDCVNVIVVADHG